MGPGVEIGCYFDNEIPVESNALTHRCTQTHVTRNYLRWAQQNLARTGSYTLTLLYRLSQKK